jgi:hypothetical protein
MNPDQTRMLLEALDKIASAMQGQAYTITGASDWPILATVGGALVVVLGFMWRDLRSVIKEVKTEGRSGDDLIWAALRDCQNDCCPRKKHE